MELRGSRVSNDTEEIGTGLCVVYTDGQTAGADGYIEPPKSGFEAWRGGRLLNFQK